jgi:hypothetical protein
MTTATSIDPSLIATLTAAAEERDGHPERGEIRFRCPFPDHVDNHPSARWSPDKATFFCDVCGKGGGAIDFAKLLGLDIPKFSPNGHHQPKGLTLAQYAGAKRLPLAFLQGLGLRDARYSGNPAVETPYLDENEQIAGTRYRTALTGGDRFKWRKGDHICLYGRERRQLALDRGYGILVGGESDSQTLWLHDEPAFGLAGEGNWKDERDASTLDDIPVVYVVIEPDQGGEALRKKLNTSRIRDRFRVIDLMGMVGVKDPSALYLNDPEQFTERWAAAKTKSIPLVEFVIPPSSPLFTSSEQNESMFSCPEFPIDAIPEPAHSFIIEAAAALGVPVEMVAVPLLGYAGCAMGRAWTIKIKAGFEQRAIFYVALVAPPGSVKTPSLDAARSGLDELQKKAFKRFSEQLERWTTNVEAAKDAKLPEPERPVLEHLLTTNATMEAVSVMAMSSPGFVLHRDEILGWVKSCDAYRGGKGGDRQEWLSSWSGGQIKVDRKKSDPIYVENPHIGVVGSIQPDMLAELADEASRRDGFVERILWCMPDVQPSGWTEDEISSTTLAKVESLFAKLRYEHGEDWGNLRTPITVSLSQEAKVEWRSWYDENIAGIAKTEGISAGIAAKLPLQLARLCLVLHALAHPDNPPLVVSGETMQNAIDLVEYFRGQALRALPSFQTSPVRGQAAGVKSRIRRILDRAAGEWVTRTEINNKLKGAVDTEEITEALNQLSSSEEAEMRTVPTGGRPREEWKSLTSEKEVKGEKGGISPEFDRGKV